MFTANKIFANNKVGDIKSGNKLIEKYKKLSKTEKLSKSRNLKSKKLFKSQKSAKLEIKLLKSENLLKFNIKKNGPSFLNPKTKMAFNYLQLIFTKTLIF